MFVWPLNADSRSGPSTRPAGELVAERGSQAPAAVDPCALALACSGNARWLRRSRPAHRPVLEGLPEMRRPIGEPCESKIARRTAFEQVPRMDRQARLTEAFTLRCPGRVLRCDWTVGSCRPARVRNGHGPEDGLLARANGGFARSDDRRNAPRGNTTRSTLVRDDDAWADGRSLVCGGRSRLRRPRTDQPHLPRRRRGARVARRVGVDEPPKTPPRDSRLTDAAGGARPTRLPAVSCSATRVPQPRMKDDVPCQAALAGATTRAAVDGLDRLAVRADARGSGRGGLWRGDGRGHRCRG